MISITELPGWKGLVSCLPGVSVPRGSGLSGVVASRCADRCMTAVNGRPRQASVVTWADQVSAYAHAVISAELRQKRIDGGFALGAFSAAEHPTMRAFRGLEPWRDPA